MQFCGVSSKYNIGQVVYMKEDDDSYSFVHIDDIGILGGKLSKWVFLYEVRDYNGKVYNVTEERLTLTNIEENK